MDANLGFTNRPEGRISTTLEVLGRIVRENTERTYSRFSRTLAVYMSSAFATGFALGMTAGIIIQRCLRDRCDTLELQIESIRSEVAALRETSTHRGSNRFTVPVILGSYLDAEADVDDEFFEARSHRSSDSFNFLSPETSNQSICGASSTSSSYGRMYAPLKLSSDPFPVELAQELDLLAEAALKSPAFSDSLNIDVGASSGYRAFSRCLVYKKQYRRRPEYLWRLARAAYLVSLDRCVRGSDCTSPPDNATLLSASSNVSSISSTDSAELRYLRQTAQEWTDLGLSVARRGVDLAKIGLTHENGVSQSDAAQAYKWLAIFVGLVANSSGINQKIQLGYEFKELIDTAIALNPSDAYCHFLKGRWCYEVYNLSWVERQFASRLFAEPPSATIEEARTEFLEVERLKPNYWPSNLIYLAKCEFELSMYTAAKEWIDKASILLNSANIDDVGDLSDRNSLLTEVASLQPKYASWVPS